MAPAIDRISRVGGSHDGSYTYYPVLIVGAGESGIAMACRLRQILKFDQFRIFDRRSGIGGTWYGNRYPGVACDVPAIMYSFSWAQNPHWSSPFPSGDDIVRYLYDVCERFQILDKIQLETSVRSAQWLDAEEEWEVVLEYLAPGVGDMGKHERKTYESTHGAGAAVLRAETVRAKIVCSAAGGLVEPKANLNVPGIDTFEGEIIHTARWDHNISFEDKNVVIVGTGCTSAQIVPQLIKPEYGAKSVTQLMRSPPWAVPFLTPEATEKWNEWVPWLCSRIPGFQNTFRKLMFLGSEVEFLALFPDSPKAQKNREAKAAELTRYLRKMLPEKYHEVMTPDYQPFCKRRVIDEGWYASLNDPRIEITSLPLTRIDHKTVTLGPGRHFPPMSRTDSAAPTEEKTIPCDILIQAHGFETTDWLHPLDVTGRDGRSLHKVWKERGGAQGYMGSVMDGFPNFFMIFGPNTATGHTSVILASEGMVDYSLNFIKGILNGDVRTWEVKESAEREWTERLQRELRSTVFGSGGARNWYVDQKTGWNSTTYPRTQIDFSLRCMFPNWSHWNGVYTRKGMVKLQLGRILKVFNVAAALYSLMYLIRNGRAESQAAILRLVGLGRKRVMKVLDVLRARV